MNDMRSVIQPKSDQINADDLVGGPRTITIAEVKIRPDTEQPVSIHFDGDNGKPYKPCKTMSRVMVECWGPDANKYIGRSMTLYRDPTVPWGGMAVGGIRISHMSHIDAEKKQLAVTLTKGKRKPHIILRLDTVDKAAVGAAELVDRIKAAFDRASVIAITEDATVVNQLKWLVRNRPDLADRVDAAVSAALAMYPAPVNNGFPGDAP